MAKAKPKAPVVEEASGMAMKMKFGAGLTVEHRPDGKWEIELTIVVWSIAWLLG